MSHNDYPRNSHEREEKELLAVRKKLAEAHRIQKKIETSWDDSTSEERIEMVEELEKILQSIETYMQETHFLETLMSPLELFNILVIRDVVEDGKRKLGMV
jgi:hypothetical protein